MWKKGVKAWDTSFSESRGLQEATSFLSSGRDSLRCYHLVGDTLVSFIFVKAKKKKTPIRELPINVSGTLLIMPPGNGWLPLSMLVYWVILWQQDIYQCLELHSRNAPGLTISYLCSCHLRCWGISCKQLPGAWNYLGLILQDECHIMCLWYGTADNVFARSMIPISDFRKSDTTDRCIPWDTQY